MKTGVQWTATIPAKTTKTWYTWGWAATSHIVWYLMSNTPKSGAAQLDWDVAVGRADANNCTYWITVTNLTSTAITFEGRYAVLS